VARIVAAARLQPSIKAIWCWDNSGEGVVPSSFDLYIKSSVNLGCSPRWWIAQRATTDYVAVIDDDLILRDDAIDRCIEASKQELVVGAFGRRLNPTKSYGKCSIIRAGLCDIVLGRFVFMPIAQALMVGHNPEPFEDDIFASSRFTAMKLIVPRLTRELHAGPKRFAVCGRAGHYEAREAARRRYFTK
jgi:hypothetical protein